MGSPSSGQQPLGGGGGGASQAASNVQDIINKAKTLFTDDPRFEYEGQLGGVHNGTAMRFKEKGTKGRRFVAKAGTTGTEDALKKEIDYLKVSEFLRSSVCPQPRISLAN